MGVWFIPLVYSLWVSGLFLLVYFYPYQLPIFQNSLLIKRMPIEYKNKSTHNKFRHNSLNFPR